jgi:hypothetical protein
MLHTINGQYDEYWMETMILIESVPRPLPGFDLMIHSQIRFIHDPPRSTTYTVQYVQFVPHAAVYHRHDDDTDQHVNEGR